MNDRIPLDNLTSNQLDQLYDDLDQARTHADPELHTRLTAAINALGKSETELKAFRAANTRVRNLAARIRQGAAPWTANDDDIADHIVAAIAGDQAPAASCSPAAPETEPNNPAATEATERPTLRERHRAQWLALTDAERAARIAALDEDDEPGQPARTTPPIGLTNQENQS